MTGEENKYTNMEAKDNTIKDAEVGLYLHVVEEEEDRDDGHGSHKDQGESTYFSASLHIINTIMGAGILSLPVVFRYLGIVLGLVFVLFIGATTIFSVYLLLKCREITGKNGYAMFAKISYGAAGSLIVKLIIIINNIGLCCAYFIIFGTTCKNLMSVFVDEDSYWVSSYHNYIFILFIFLVMFFLVYRENLDSLKSASFLGVMGIVIFFICLNIIFFYKMSQGQIEHPTSEMLWPNGKPLDIIGSLPTVFLAFTFQFNVFPIFFTLKTKTKPEMMRATLMAVCFCTLIYSVSGIMGYIMYRDDLKDTILQALTLDVQKYKGKDNFLIVMLILINIGFLFSSTMSIPLMFFSLKNNFVNSIIFCKKKFFVKKIESINVDNRTSIVGNSETFENIGELSDSGDDVTNNIPTVDKYKNTPMTKIVKYVIITILYFFICFVAIVIPELKVIFNLVGSTAANSLSFILPNLFFLKLASMSNIKINRIPSIILFIIGVIILVVCLFGEIIRLFV